MRARRDAWFGVAGWGTSLALHLGGLAVLAAGISHAPRPSYGPTRVSFDVIAPRRATVAPPSTTVRPPVPLARRVARAPDAPDPPAPAREPPPPTGPVDLTGVTLTGQGSSWSSVVGNGARMEDAIRAPGARPARPPPVASSEPVVSRRVSEPKPVVLPMTDLSRRPVPPALDSVLKSHYPVEARQRGLSGLAVVRARVDADGRVRIARIASESDAGFGEACRRTVVGSTWSPPQDRAGRPAATEVSYTCRFEVER